MLRRVLPLYENATRRCMPRSAVAAEQLVGCRDDLARFVAVASACGVAVRNESEWRFAPNGHAFDPKSQVHCRFVRMLRQEKIATSFAEYLQHSHPSAPTAQIGFHGTVTESLRSIFRSGFDVTKRGARNGQELGPGEYFGVDADLASSYADRPAVIVTLIVAPAAALKASSGNVLVVDNPLTARHRHPPTYCLPLGAFGLPEVLARLGLCNAQPSCLPRHGFE